MTAKKRFYAVRKGHKPGIYRSWDDCRAQVDGFSKAEYKGFLTREEAEDYLKEARRPKPPATAEIVHTQAALPLIRHDSATQKEVVMYTDGACTGNPGPGGYGAVLIYGNRRKELSAGFRLTTNNRMEILACIAGLQALKEPCDVTIHSDSKYVVNSMTKSWALKWRKNGWRRKDKDGQYKDALNSDLWAQMLELCDKHSVQFHWVRGHAGNKENERCDQLAREAAAARRLGADVVYETCRKSP